MKIKNKRAFIILISIYIFGWFYFNVMSGGIESIGPKVWMAISVVLIPLIWAQTNIDGHRLNNSIMLSYVVNLIFMALGDAIVLQSLGGNKISVISAFFSSLFIIFMIIGSGILFAFFIIWKFGHISDYLKFHDVMTKEQHECFVKFIRKWEERFCKKRKRDE
ncbi:MAG: hypothetical protein Q4A29_01765 [Eubacteriales bacterium]|nr:hypothetical protein [Eubacteriales bacterium]